ncbi:PREDICTED: pre-mRNA-splicing factor SYF1 [Cercocebus atys]|uniref:pre-mRNA-splicing factor SYF1 n=1 Tax=Cercocebus atys TaxID=9531 RepID=UPI0005F37091|nr:PREDICTED: pre-mRNA-splicing factor SYF1 [Cercocebus atys]
MVVMARLSRPERPDLVFEEEDLPYEEEIMRNQFSVKCWLRYIEFKQGAPKPRLNQLYERALKLLPCSYKLWYRYLKARRAQVKHRCVTDPAYEDVNNCHERAFVFMHKMPRLWLDYCQFLMDQGRVTHTRRTFDRALRALPITQHSRIWPLYLRFLRSHPLPETAVRGYRRFLKLSPESAEEYIEYLKSSDRLDEAAQRLATVVNDERFVSKAGKSNYQLWHELCDLISQNPDKVQSLNVDAIIRGGLTRFTDQLGKLWCSLADYYIRSGHFEKARDVYEEAIRTVMTVRDFTQVFDSYAQFEESMIAAKMETASELGREEEDDVDLELRLARFEQLISRRPLLLNSVLLRQNPHHVHEWHKRVALHQGRPREIINTYTEAVQTVDPFKATGKPHTLWVAFAKFYEDNGQLDDARVILEKATKVNFKQVDDLASVWCQCGELELRHENYDEALRLLRKATALPARRAEYFDGSEPVQNRVYKSLKVWSMLADLEESLGTFQSTKAVYDRILDLRIATPQIVINYAMFLEEHKYFEESFKAYERGRQKTQPPACPCRGPAGRAAHRAVALPETLRHAAEAMKLTCVLYVACTLRRIASISLMVSLVPADLEVLPRLQNAPVVVPQAYPGSQTGSRSCRWPGRVDLPELALHICKPAAHLTRVLVRQHLGHRVGMQERDQPSRAQSKILFVRSDASREELAELAQQVNPEEIQLGEDEDEDEMDLEPNEVRLEQQSVPAAVFGSLKED